MIAGIFGALVLGSASPGIVVAQAPSPVPGSAAADSEAPASTQATSDQQESEAQSSEEQTPSLSGLRASDLPQNAFGEPPTGVPYRSLFRYTGAPYTGMLRTSPLSDPVKFGPVEGRVSTAIPHFRVGTPFLKRGLEPSDAHLKLGPVYIRFTSLSAGVIVSDNVNLSENDRESGAIAIVRSGFIVSTQITEGFQLNLAGSVAWLPLEGKAGLSGLGLASPYLLSTDYSPLVQGQFSYDTQVAGWPVIFADDFHVHTGQWLESNRDDFVLFDGFEFNEEDRAGRYAFRGGHPLRPDQQQVRSSENLNTDLLYLNNTVSATTMKDLPSEVHFRAGIYHDNFFYWNDQGADLPSRRDMLRISANSFRENLRFKPYAVYRLIDTDQTQGLDNEFRAGVTGPITDQLSLRTDAGVYFNTASAHAHLLWDFSLQHVAGPLTTESLFVNRSYDDLNQTLVGQAGYRLDQVIGKNLQGQFFISESWYDDVSGRRNAQDFTQLRTGLRFNYFVSPKTEMRLGATIGRYDSNTDDATTWTFRYDISRHITDTLTAHLLLQRQVRDSSRHGQSYEEDAAFLNVTKFFE